MGDHRCEFRFDLRQPIEGLTAVPRGHGLGLEMTDPEVDPEMVGRRESVVSGSEGNEGVRGRRKALW